MEREAMRLRELWATLFRELGTEVPSLTQFYVWLSNYPARTVEKALRSTLKKAFYMSQRADHMTFSHQVNYATKVMKMETQQEIERELGPIEPEKLTKPAAPYIPVSVPTTFRKLLINPFTGKPVINPTTGEPVYEEEK